jgi:two-component system response regulator AdeR
MPAQNQSVVMAVADRRESTYDEWPGEDWDVNTAADGEAVLAAVDADVGVVVLDRGHPDVDATRVLDEIRADGLDVPVIALVDEEPASDALGMRFNDYLVHPIEQSTFASVVDAMVDLDPVEVQKAEYLALAASQAALEVQLSLSEQAESEEYGQLTERIGALRDRAEEPLEELEEAV